MCFIVAHQNCDSKIFDYIPDLFNKEKIENLKSMFSSEDILATRNCILLYKALKINKTREVYICRNSFHAIEGKYPFMCLFEGSNLYLDPKKAPNYPSEILDRRLYLGDRFHAHDKTVLHNLGITHILNVTNNVENMFEEDKHMKITYERINIEDSEDVPIHHSFSLAYDFIEKALATKKTAKQRCYQTNFDMVQYFKDAKKASKTLVSSAIKTNDIIVNLSKGSIENVNDYVKDKMYQIDQKSESKLQNSHNQNRVLVHCAMGRSRSVTMVIIYLMIKFQISWDHAFDILKVRREIIDPNDGFIQKLKDFEGKQYKDSAQELASLKSLHIEDTSDDSSSSEDAKEDSKHTFSKLPSSLESKF